MERDFVELPSQLYEHWLKRPEVLQQLRRATTRPASRCRRRCSSACKAARNFNQGFETVEYLAAAIVDLDLHALEDAEGLDVDRFEQETLARIGMPEEIVMRHRIPHFQHIIGRLCGGLLQLPVVGGDGRRRLPAPSRRPATSSTPSSPAGSTTTSTRAGGKRDAAEAYKAFRGRLPTTEALLEKRGLTSPKLDQVVFGRVGNEDEEGSGLIAFRISNLVYHHW